MVACSSIEEAYLLELSGCSTDGWTSNESSWQRGGRGRKHLPFSTISSRDCVLRETEEVMENGGNNWWMNGRTDGRMKCKGHTFMTRMIAMIQLMLMSSMRTWSSCKCVGVYFVFQSEWIYSIRGDIHGRLEEGTRRGWSKRGWQELSAVADVFVVVALLI